MSTAHTAAVAERLAQVTIDGQHPTVHIVDVGDNPGRWYYIVTPSPGGGLDGPLARPDDDLDTVTLVTSVAVRHPDGQGALQCQYLLDQARAVLLGTQLEVTGLTVMRVRLDVPGGVAIDRDPNPHRFFAVDRFITSLTP